MSLFKKVGKFFKKVAKVALPVLKFGVGFVPGVGSLAAKALQLGSVKKGLAVARAVKGAGAALRPTVAPPSSPGAALVALKHARHPHKVAGSRRAAAPRRATRRRTVTPRGVVRRTTRKRTGRKLKFGSPAWRKKYMKKGRRRRG